MSKVVKIGSRKVVTRDKWGRKWGMVNEYKVAVLQIEKFLEICFTTMQIYLTLQMVVFGKL